MPRVKLLASLGSAEFPEEFHGLLEDQEIDVTEAWAAKLLGRRLAVVVEVPPEDKPKKPVKKPEPAPVVVPDPVVIEETPADPPKPETAAEKVAKDQSKETPKADPAVKQSKSS